MKNYFTDDIGVTKLSFQILTRIVEQSPSSIVVTDSDGLIEYCNPAFKNLTGYGLDDVFGKNPRILQSGKTPPSLYVEMWETISSGGVWSGEFCNRKKNGDIFWERAVISALLDNAGNIAHFIAIKNDITEEKHAYDKLLANEEKYRQLSIVDELTQLYNSRHFYDQLKHETSRANRYGGLLTLILIDIDNFKNFNDSYGHLEGDRVLARFGEVVKKSLRATDSSYRYGGEEFMVILPITSREEGCLVAEKIRVSFKEEVFTPAPDVVVNVTLSIGVVQYEIREDIKNCIKRADDLLYIAKEKGKDIVVSE